MSASRYSRGHRVAASSPAFECGRLRTLFQFQHPCSRDTSGNVGGVVGAAVAHHNKFDVSVDRRATQRGKRTFDHRCLVVRRDNDGTPLTWPRKLGLRNGFRGVRQLMPAPSVQDNGQEFGDGQRRRTAAPRRARPPHGTAPSTPARDVAQRNGHGSRPSGSRAQVTSRIRLRRCCTTAEGSNRIRRPLARIRRK